jgi:hypothetical protein
VLSEEAEVSFLEEKVRDAMKGKNMEQKKISGLLLSTSSTYMPSSFPTLPPLKKSTQGPLSISSLSPPPPSSYPALFPKLDSAPNPPHPKPHMLHT